LVTACAWASRREDRGTQNQTTAVLLPSRPDKESTKAGTEVKGTRD
jgi:hypothetical protein